MLDIFLTISLVAVFIGSITDIKTLEVPDWLNYSLVAIGLGGHLLFSIFYNDWNYIISSGLGLIFSLIVGYVMFYTGQWGGGDSKMIFGLGALLGISYPLQFDFYFKFLINVLFFGAFYGLLWTIFMGIKNRKKFLKRLKIEYRNKKLKRIRIISGIFSIFFLSIATFVHLEVEFRIMIFGLTFIMYFMNYLLIIVKAIEKVSMIKLIDPEKLTEGDWIVNNIKVDGKKIVGPKDLGISKEQINQLIKFKEEGKITKIKVKYGIPFVPSFLFALVYTTITNTVIFLSMIYY